MRGRALVVLMMSAGLAGWVGLGAPGAWAAPPPGAAQEIALDGLTIGTQTVHGPHGLAEAFYPPPAAPLATTGSFVRIFFSYSPQAAAGSTMTVAFNGHELGTVQLTSSHAAGGVDEFPIPADVIDLQKRDRLQVRFELTAPGLAAAAAEALYARIDSRTLVHYHLALPASGAPSLQTYPFSLLATDATLPVKPTLAVALPAPPDLTEVSAALTVLAELGRRAATQRLAAKVLSLANLASPETQGAAIVLIGRLDRLPAATSVLEESGWRPAGVGWDAPDGRLVGPDDGIVTATISPWDHRTPVLLVSGATTQALGKAAAELAGPAVTPVDQQSVDLIGPAADDVIAGSGGRTVEADLSFTSPAVAPDGNGSVLVHVPPLGPAQAQGSIRVTVNGSPVGAGQIDRQGLNTTTVEANLPGRVLRPGLNSLTVTLSAAPASGPASADGSPVTVALRLPGPPGGELGLEALPFPFLSATRPAARVVLGDLSQATLTAAVQTAIGLGHRSWEPAGQLVAVLPGDSALAGQDDLIVVGQPSGSVAVSGLLQAAPHLLPAPGSGEGLLEVMRSGSRAVLLVGHTGAAALYDRQLAGPAAVVDAGGRVSEPAVANGPGSQRVTGISPSRGTGPVGLLILGAGIVLLAAVVLQLVHVRRHST